MKNYTLLQMMKYALPRPAMFTGKKDIHMFHVFLAGFMMGWNNVEENQFYADWKQWACQHQEEVIAGRCR
jgi:hypothetical protein